MSSKPTTSDKASPSEVRSFMANANDPANNDGVHMVPPREIMALKKEDPEGYDSIARGISDGSLTY